MTAQDLNVTEQDLHVMQGSMTVARRLAICFAAGVVSAMAGTFRPRPVLVGTRSSGSDTLSDRWQDTVNISNQERIIIS